MENLRTHVFERNTEIISAFFTNRYYNEIYAIAKDFFAKQGGKSLTEVYAKLLLAHLKDIDDARPGNDGVLRDAIRALHTYYCSYMGETTLDDFIGRIVSQIVPEDFFSTMGGREKDSILRNIVKQTALIVGKKAMQDDMLHRIIDKRNDQVGVGILRDLGITVLRDFRASFISKLYGKDIASSSSSAGRAIPYDLYDKVRGELKKLLDAYVLLEAEHKQTLQENARLKKAIGKLRKEVTDAQSLKISERVPDIMPVAPVMPAVPIAPVASIIPSTASAAPVAQMSIVPVAPVVSKPPSSAPSIVEVLPKPATDMKPVISPKPVGAVAIAPAVAPSAPIVAPPMSATQIKEQLLNIPGFDLADVSSEKAPASSASKTQSEPSGFDETKTPVSPAHDAKSDDGKDGGSAGEADGESSSSSSSDEDGVDVSKLAGQIAAKNKGRK